MCACHSPVYHYIIVAVVYLVQPGSQRIFVERAVWYEMRDAYGVGVLQDVFGV